MRTVAVVGASLAGLSAARALRAQSYDGRVVVVGAERHRPYDRPPLSKEFLADTASLDDLALTTAEDDKLDLDWRLGATAVRLDRAGACVVLDSGEEIAADGVVLATGARARTLPGPPLAGVHTLRTLEDAISLRQALSTCDGLVVIGAGFIGAEVASTASGLGVDVTVIEALATPLAGPLGAEMGQVCAGLHADHGVRLITGVGVAGLVGDDRVRAVQLTDGRELPADVVLVGIGAIPCTDWLSGSGLELRHGGIVTDAGCATAIPSVVATGDCAASYSNYAGDVLRLEHWTNALHQPTLAVATLLGQPPPALPATAHVPYFWSDQYGANLQFAGHHRDGDRVEVVEGDTDSRSFLAVYRRDGLPVAVFAVNQPKLFGRWRRELAARPAAVAEPA